MATLPADGQAVPGECTPVPEDNAQARPSSQSSGWKAVGYAFGSRSRGRTPVSEGAPAKVGTSAARDSRPSTPSAPPPAAVVTVEQLESALAMSACAIRCVSLLACMQDFQACNSLLALVQFLLKPSVSRVLFITAALDRTRLRRKRSAIRCWNSACMKSPRNWRWRDEHLRLGTTMTRKWQPSYGLPR